MPSVQLREAREVYQDRREKLGKVFEEAKTTGDDGKGVTDFRLVKCLDIKDGDGKSIAVAEKIDEMNTELNECYDNVVKLELAEKAADNLRGQDAQRKPITHPEGKGGDNVLEFKSPGQAMVESDIFKNEWAKGNKSRTISIPEFGLDQIQNKTLFQTGAGWAPESVRLPRVVLDAQRPIEIIDLIPSGQTGQAAIKFMEETTFTNAAAEVAEGGTFGESAFALTERTSPVEKVGTWIPVTDEQLEDVAEASSYLDSRLRFAVRQRLDGQILVGDGSTPNLKGFLNVSGILTQAKGTDPVPDAFYKAIDLVLITGRAQPSGIIVHPTDWQGIRLLRTADGVYIWGNPSEAGPQRLWGVPVALSTAITLNTGLVGDFTNFTQLFERRGLEVKITDSHSDFFIKGKQVIRADIRVALVTYRPAALCTVTGI